MGACQIVRKWPLRTMSKRVGLTIEIPPDLSEGARVSRTASDDARSCAKVRLQFGISTLG